MAKITAATPKGTRDFSPDELAKRNYIFDTIKAVYEKFGYQQLETPAMENLDTLTGKYGEEGDRLIFKILNSGDFIENISDELEKFSHEKIITNSLSNKIKHNISNLYSYNNEHLEDWIPIFLKKSEQLLKEFKEENTFIFKDSVTENAFFDRSRNFLQKQLLENLVESFTNRLAGNQQPKEERVEKVTELILSFKNDIEKISSNKLAPKISEKALRYDLTVPFARYVVQHRNDIRFPFKRYQIQPVWRADRPQKGRYREFYQCDADVIGSDSLWNEVELVLIFDEVLSTLNLPGFSIKLNNRKILAGLAEVTGVGENLPSFLIALDKLDKIGREKVLEELVSRGFDTQTATDALDLACAEGDAQTKLELLRNRFSDSEIGKKGLEELEFVLDQSKAAGLRKATLEFDLSLARGLEYYTGAIFEVKAHGVQMGSICGGGRYDNLTGIFGLDGVSGVGISFGADRIYDVLEELGLFPESVTQSVKLLFMNFGEAEAAHSLKLAQALRAQGISCELYPDTAKIPKQFEHAEKKGIEWTAIIGSNEMANGQVQLKNMRSKQQITVNTDELAKTIQANF